MHGFVGQLHVARLAVGIGVDGHRPDAHLAGRLDDAAGDFAAVGNKYLAEHDQPFFWLVERSEALIKPPPWSRLCRAVGGRPLGAGAKRLGGTITSKAFIKPPPRSRLCRAV